MKTKLGLFSLLLRLAKDRHAGSHRLLARLLRDEEGAWLISMTIMLPVLIGVAGLGTEGGMLFYQHRSLQSAADAAAYSAAIACSYTACANSTTQAQAQTQAQATVASYGFTLGTGTNQANVTATATTYATLPAVRVTISRPQTAIFSSILFSVLPNSVSATAVINGGSNSNPSGNCLLALGQNPSTGTNNLADAISLQGNPEITVNNCGIFSDSTDCTSGSYSESLGGNASFGTSTNPIGSVGSAGCINIFGNAKVYLPNSVTCSSSGSTACTQNDGTISDPYHGTTLPSETGLSCQNPSSNPLQPGLYCGGLNLKNAGTVTMNPGVYILDAQGSKGTGLTVKKTTLTDDGAGVTLVFTCNVSGQPCNSSQWPSQMLSTDSNSIVCATAPGTGAATAGFVMMGDPAMPLDTQFTTWANGSSFFNGTVWAPTADFNWGGNATTAPSACNYSSGVSNFCLQLIANQVTLGGTSGFGGGGCSLSGGSGGQKQKPIGSTVTLVD